ncbi:hypothetical protein F5Y19DRAFT_131064 [Xylariaceae sp. FL1651]|nr:hypothetical protein F5Y19DRAFT_131064 [Xylariaceae sp. FL1651]
MTSSAAQLRGSCHCGRNQYAIEIPSGSSRLAEIIFDLNANHRMSSASPLSAFIRVPLTWYHSRVFPFFPDEIPSTIKRVYAHPTEQHTRRNFCGYCGTPLSYWSEQPPSEADFIRLTLGSLLTEDLHGLQELDLLPDYTEHGEMKVEPTTMPQPGRELIGRETTSIPWFETLISGSHLGNMHTTRSVQQSRDGSVRVEFEITEWTAEDDAEGETSESSTTGKRKRAGAGDDGIGTFA